MLEPLWSHIILEDILLLDQNLYLRGSIRHEFNSNKVPVSCFFLLFLLLNKKSTIWKRRVNPQIAGLLLRCKFEKRSTEQRPTDPFHQKVSRSTSWRFFTGFSGYLWDCGAAQFQKTSMHEHLDTHLKTSRRC